MQQELMLSVDQLNASAAMNYGGLAVGCIFFIPLVHKHGRRLLYLISSVLQLASVIWLAKTNNFGDLMGSNLLAGLGGAISETVVQITIADIFFVHQHGTMNRMLPEYVVKSQGWRWIWWWCVIFLVLNLLLVMFLFEESKYIPVLNGHGAPQMTGSLDEGEGNDTQKPAKQDDDSHQDPMERIQSRIDTTMPRKTYRQRMALLTTTSGPIKQHFWQPVVLLFTFPAVAFAAVTYGTILASFAILTSVQAIYLLQPPYNFGSEGVGLMNVAPFVGACIGFFFGGYFNDKLIVWLSKRNGGIYEPEQRLWVSLPSIVLLPGSIIMFGVGLSHGAHWAVLAVAFGIFGFNFLLVNDIALAYVTDCYQELVGDALVGVVFIRNVLSVVVLFSLTPWTNGMGIQNVHILVAFIIFAVLLLPIPLLIWGKKARMATAVRYREMAMRQPSHRTLPE
ncbi:hypothetical protein SNOG_15651 [Parastagonospora nodorum SN15]|uniref:Major facilitator superfamily (MFS) profile domain-containing protein n=1 Tax=Phaeosphaeria nodorum (strain SN15 / ATCC MYA-4574 / FGSC 10173) TaxID=321614 RepID=Q0TY25_PHANO|nr:hypothetical protein SNOG_15651 [Parastagonospora nodorum SN15]EAT77026.2 hypothetical protein SNOG_15651 [Parastagonospora nodorum SN15]